MPKIGTNVRYKFTEDELIIRIKLDHDAQPSQSGKTLLLASTNGFNRIDEDGGVSMNLVVTKPLEKKKKK